MKFRIENASDPETLEKPEVDQDLADKRSIVLYNDDVNTFDWVIHCLMEICDHTPEQAEQCSIIVHYKGKCSVKSGTWEELEPQCTALLDRGLSAEIH